MSEKFHKELEKLKDDLLEMATLAKEMLDKSVDSLKDQDKEVADWVISKKYHLAELEAENITQAVSSITGEVLMTRDGWNEFKSKLLKGKGGIQGFMEATLAPF